MMGRRINDWPVSLFFRRFIERVGAAMREGCRSSLVIFTLLLCPYAALAQNQSSDDVWKRVDETPVHPLDFAPPQGANAPASTFQLDQLRIRAILHLAPQEFTEQAQNNQTILTIPFPDGTFEHFRVEASPVINKPLESKGFETETYKGTGVEDPTATIRFEQAFDGFHAMVRSSRGVFYVDPTTKTEQRESQKRYLSYFASARPGPIRRLHCEVGGEQARSTRQNGDSNRPQARLPNTLATPAQPGLRSYRLALAVNSYYVSAVYDSSVSASPFDQAAAAVTRTINRINEIYEAEFGIHLQFVPNEATLIYVDPSSDPYRSVNAKAPAALPLNQSNLDHVIGKENYDIGHLFTTAAAGRARVRSVCNAETKAQGVTGIANPVGDAFDVDYVSHEIGHQFGADHTFNAISESCNGNRNSATAYEPGSGSTIMGYAGKGICDPESLQDDSDSYFHLVSLLEISGYISDTSPGAGGSCGTFTPITFPPPSLSAAGSYTVPKGTPFVLTSDLQQSPANPTVFNWEEFDLGDPAPPDDDSGPLATPRPLFRSRKPDARVYRFFPDFETLTNTAGPTLGETMPMIERTMLFRVVGRNNHGSFTYAEVPVKVDVTSGPFKITSVSGGNSWARGSSHSIRWDTAHTNLPPVDCKTVNLFLAVDGDPSHWYSLAKGVSNSGSYNLTIAADAPLADKAYLVVRSEGNIFLDVYPFSLQIRTP
jgi:reprolysin-like metallo-peptidase family M12B